MLISNRAKVKLCNINSDQQRGSVSREVMSREPQALSELLWAEPFSGWA